MPTGIFTPMEAPALRAYLEFWLRHYRTMEASWFLTIAGRPDQNQTRKA